MDNKGQTLVAFVLVLPVILLLLLYVIDYGLVSLEKKEVISSIKESITYGLENNNSIDMEDKMKMLLEKNLNQKNIEQLDINFDSELIFVRLKYKSKSIFDFINRDITLSYTGSIQDNKIRIEKG